MEISEYAGFQAARRFNPHDGGLFHLRDWIMEMIDGFIFPSTCNPLNKSLFLAVFA